MVRPGRIETMELINKIGPIVNIEDIIPQNQLRGTFKITGQNGI